MARDGLVNTLFGRYYAPFSGNLPADIASKAIASGYLLELLPLPE
jgi:FAD dependent monooxygenase